MDAMNPRETFSPEGAVVHALLELKAIPWRGRWPAWSWVESLGIGVGVRQKWVCAVVGELRMELRTRGTRDECQTLLETLPQLLHKATKNGPLQGVQIRLMAVEESGKLPTLLWGQIPTP